MLEEVLSMAARSGGVAKGAGTAAGAANVGGRETGGTIFGAVVGEDIGAVPSFWFSWAGLRLRVQGGWWGRKVTEDVQTVKVVSVNPTAPIIVSVSFHRERSFPGENPFYR
jgi:hypothetical protein